MPQLFVVFIWLAGIVVAIVRWRQHPRVSLFVVIALTMLIFESIIGIVSTMAVPFWISSSSSSVASMGLILTGIGAIRSIIAAIAWVIVLIAVFVGR